MHYPSSNEIDNYFSIYYADKTSVAFEGWKYVSDHFLSNLLDGNVPYSEIKELVMHILLPDGEAYRLLNNTNIINQKGLFFYNNSALEPMEYAYLKQAEIMKDKLGEELYKKALIHDYFAGCFNIHKSIIPYIMDILTSKGITKEYLFPNANQMKNIVTHKATINVLCTKK